MPPTCERIYVGKRGGRPSKKQPEIDALLVGLCRAGKTVVRLKGGCPSVFSRVSSEIAALEAAGCAYELVPGVSSALAAPLLAGVARHTASGSRTQPLRPRAGSASSRAMCLPDLPAVTPHTIPAVQASP